MSATSGGESGLDALDRARCSAMARWLGASSALGAMALGAALVIAFGCVMQAWRDHASVIVLLVLASTPLERYLALRLRLEPVCNLRMLRAEPQNTRCKEERWNGC